MERPPISGQLSPRVEIISPLSCVWCLRSESQSKLTSDTEHRCGASVTNGEERNNNSFTIFRILWTMPTIIRGILAVIIFIMAGEMWKALRVAAGCYLYLWTGDLVKSVR